MGRELELEEVIEFLKTSVFADEDCEYIIELMREQLDFSVSQYKRIRRLEKLTAKMDKYIESQYHNYKEDF